MNINTKKREYLEDRYFQNMGLKIWEIPPEFLDPEDIERREYYPILVQFRPGRFKKTKKWNAKKYSPIFGKEKILKKLTKSKASAIKSSKK